MDHWTRVNENYDSPFRFTCSLEKLVMEIKS
jgi:hypothetical protein